MLTDASVTPPWPEIDELPNDVEVSLSIVKSWYSLAKIALDPCMAFFMLIPGLPIIGLFWCLVKLSSPGSGFYVQTRLGQHGRKYKIIKLRSMGQNCEQKHGGPAWATKNDFRITRIGAFLRKTHLDELPQLFNVLRGEMSLVGPRPERPEIIDSKQLNDFVPGYPHRLLVKPGVTGLAQIQLPADSDLNSVRHKIAYDLYYIENYSIWFDLRIIVATLFKAATMGPSWLRGLFFLPNREDVANNFRSTLSEREPELVTGFVPA